MDKRSAAEAVAYLAKLFPRWKITPELAALWTDRITRYQGSDEQLRAIINQHRADRRGSDPDLTGICIAFRASTDDRRVMTITGYVPTDPNGLGFTSMFEFAEWHAMRPGEWLDTPDCPAAVRDRVLRVAKQGWDELDAMMRGEAPKDDHAVERRKVLEKAKAREGKP